MSNLIAIRGMKSKNACDVSARIGVCDIRNDCKRCPIISLEQVEATPMQKIINGESYTGVFYGVRKSE